MIFWCVCVCARPKHPLYYSRWQYIFTHVKDVHSAEDMLKDDTGVPSKEEKSSRNVLD